jgi:hypothetical protein
VEHFEIAWESPESWVGPIVSTDTVFRVTAAETCCVDPLPEFGTDLPDSVYQEFHTLYVRSVDDRGLPDPSPAARSFNAKTIAPYSDIYSGPKNLGITIPTFTFRMSGHDDDGYVVGYRYALATLQDWRDELGIADSTASPSGFPELIAWLDTLTYSPSNPGEEAQKRTDADSVRFEGLSLSTGGPYNFYFFLVRAIDNAGAEERILNPGSNSRAFRVRDYQFLGPRLGITRTNAPGPEFFLGPGLWWEWSANPGQNEDPITGYSYALGDTTEWTEFSLETTRFPPSPDELFYPPPGPFSLFVRAVDAAGYITTIRRDHRFFAGPRECAGGYILVVLDTDPFNSLIIDSVWPRIYPALERGLVDFLFDGYDYRVHETEGHVPPPLALLDCATSVFWFHGAQSDLDDSVLLAYHSASTPPFQQVYNSLASYTALGGNVFVCGIQPSKAMRFFEQRNGREPLPQAHPVDFESTLASERFLPHWAATRFGLGRIEEAIGNTQGQTQAPNRLRTVTSRVRDGANPYPDLAFDPLTWPSGTLVRGFGYYDRGLAPLESGELPGAEIVYTFNDTEAAVGVRKLVAPGINGNTVLLGSHPYFVDRPAGRDLVRAVLADFGEVPSP